MKPDLVGHRVLLRTIHHADAEDLFEIYGDVQVMVFASDPVFSAVETVHQMIESVIRLEQSEESFEWAIVEKSTNKVIGTCGIHSFSACGSSCELGCLLNATYWRQGFMSESLQLLINYAFSQGIRTLNADVDRRNARSRALFERLGFDQQEGGYRLRSISAKGSIG
ncbi:GNAT family N-acetyltransferase [Photobacterium sp. CCB-ST2H9]|uniref:GNAT family N-acetyltransferase n=1 Tax=Photobacterium sp. CCB-ST2H9 TaxID=2912855 RepID=UPI002003E335|nr:GNAT family N-acetyltransferase [Photobacterium sp. CCB-ST2H9]UTM56073.1 GNAT family N-acetyltransferase [Photobacterium sp. CCB-ST2H9]